VNDEYGGLKLGETGEGEAGEDGAVGIRAANGKDVTRGEVAGDRVAGAIEVGDRGVIGNG
jgi:hypothetical protein